MSAQISLIDREEKHTNRIRSVRKENRIELNKIHRLRKNQMTSSKCEIKIRK